MDERSKEDLLEQFRRYLEGADLADSTAAAPATDLYDLFVELAALRNEVKLESRQVKSALDEFRQVFALLQTRLAEPAAAAAPGGDHNDARAPASLRPLLLELLELYDRLASGLQAIENVGRLPWWRRRNPIALGTLAEAQQISIRRLEQILAGQKVISQPCEGSMLDPNNMRVVEVLDRDDLQHGIVVDQVRPGFSWRGELLRPAEVIVNQREDNNND